MSTAQTRDALREALDEASIGLGSGILWLMDQHSYERMRSRQRARTYQRGRRYLPSEDSR